MQRHPRVDRTSPKGQDFLGTCMSCGKKNITSAQLMTDPCSNPAGMTQEEAVIGAINGLSAEQVRGWMEQVKAGTDNPAQEIAEARGQYEAIRAEYANLLDALGIGSGQLDIDDTVALLGVACSRVYGP